MQTAHADTLDDIEFDLAITKVRRQAAGAGTWVCGRLHGHRFDALVYPKHAANPEWEIGDSRISKLSLQRVTDKQTVFNWDRGEDIAAANDVAAQIVDFLQAGIADNVYAD